MRDSPPAGADLDLALVRSFTVVADAGTSAGPPTPCTSPRRR
jgi:hypothetical protein